MPKDQLSRAEKFSASRPIAYIGPGDKFGMMSEKKLAKKMRKRSPKKVAGKR